MVTHAVREGVSRNSKQLKGSRSRSEEMKKSITFPCCFLRPTFPNISSLFLILNQPVLLPPAILSLISSFTLSELKPAYIGLKDLHSYVSLVFLLFKWVNCTIYLFVLNKNFHFLFYFYEALIFFLNICFHFTLDLKKKFVYTFSIYEPNMWYLVNYDITFFSNIYILDLETLIPGVYHIPLKEVL